MPDVLFIGDEVTARGFRLAGWPVAIPGADLEAMFDAACDSTWLIVLTAAVARRLPQRRLDAAYAQGKPLVLQIPDAVGGAVPAAIGAQIRVELGAGA